MRGYGFQGGSSREGWGRGAAAPGVGVALKESLREPGRWSFLMLPFGETLAYDDNRIELTDDLDQWGIPIPRVTGEIGDNERRMREGMKSDGAEMLEAAGATDIHVFDDPYRLGGGHPRDGDCAHERHARDGRRGPLQPRPRDPEPLRHRRLVYDLGRLPEPVADVHGVYRPRRGPRRPRAHQTGELRA